MKTLLAIIAFFIVNSTSVYAQWTTGTGDINNTNTGNIGINTTSPQSKLHIAGNNTTAGAPILILQNYIHTGLVGSVRFASGYNNFDHWSGIEGYGTGGVDQQDLRFYTTLGTRNERMRIDQSGNVGIGTTAAYGYKLDVNGAVVFRSGVSVASDVWHTSVDGAARFYFGNNDKTFFGSKNGYEFRSNTDAAISVLTNAGNFGIGTAAPLAKLDVRGNIYCGNTMYVGTADGSTSSQIAGYALAVNGTAVFNKAKVKLYGNWPDYVFEEKYNLLPLADLEKFLKENKHLPEVPSAMEIAKDGIDLGDNQSILLKKIEELTLYVIEQNKKVEEQNIELRNLQKQVIILQQK